MVSWKQLFAKFSLILAEKWVLHQIESCNTTLSWKLCFVPFWVENSVFQNFHHFSLKNAFCIRSSHGIQLIFKTVFCSILGWKQLFNKCSPFVAKNAFCIKSIHGIQIFLKNCVLLHFRLNVFQNFLPFFAEKCDFNQIQSWETTLSLKLCLAPLWIENSVLSNFYHFLRKNVFWHKPTRGITLFLENCVLAHFWLKTAFCKSFTICRLRRGLALNPLMDFKTVF